LWWWQAELLLLLLLPSVPHAIPLVLTVMVQCLTLLLYCPLLPLLLVVVLLQQQVWWWLRLTRACAVLASHRCCWYHPLLRASSHPKAYQCAAAPAQEDSIHS
jgi:hypothetical protein